jgi:arylsulfatase A-like enzyme
MTDGIVELADLFPTLCELAGIPSSEKMRAQIEGVSFVPLLREPGRAWKHGAFSWWNNAGATIVTADYTYTDWPTGQRMMYHLPTDPEENVNIAAAPEHQPARARLERMLRSGWKAAAPPF